MDVDQSPCKSAPLKNEEEIVLIVFCMETFFGMEGRDLCRSIFLSFFCAWKALMYLMHFLISQPFLLS